MSAEPADAAYAGIASGLQPPYYAVIFTSRRSDGDNGYGEASDAMVALAARQPGFLGIESARGNDGVGITGASTSPQRRTFGLAGMRERISALRGTIRVHSRKGQGTRITVNVPAPRIAEEPELVSSTISMSRARPAVGTGTTD